MDSYDLGQRSMLGFCEHGNETSGSIKYGKILDRVTISF
jgi:hypothetical protein